MYSKKVFCKSHLFFFGLFSDKICLSGGENGHFKLTFVVFVVFSSLSATYCDLLNLALFHNKFGSYGVSLILSVKLV